MLEALTGLAGMLLGAAFGAGGAWFMMKQLRKDLNGLGAVVRREKETTVRELESIRMALLLISKNDPERRQIAEFLDKSIAEK